MNADNQNQPDSKRKISTTDWHRQVGRNIGQELLYKVILEKKDLRELALHSLVVADSEKSVEAVRKLILTVSADEIVPLLMDKNHQIRNVAEQAFSGNEIEQNLDQERLLEIKNYLIRHYNISLQMAEKVVAGRSTLFDILFPFVMRQTEQTHIPQMEEMVSEPDCKATAAHVSAWVYRAEGKIVDIVLAGHANLPVCKEVSAKLASTRLRLKTQPEDTLLVTGAGIVSARGQNASAMQKQSKDKPPLEDLFEQLNEMNKITGMINIHDADKHTVANLKNILHSLVKEGIEANSPIIVKPDPLETDSPAIFMPFYLLKGTINDQLSFELQRDDFGEEFDDLLSLHRYEYYSEMIADVKRRKRIYEDWLARDLRGLNAAVGKMFEILKSCVNIENSRRKEKAYVKLLQREQFPVELWNPAQPIENRHILLQVRTQALYDFLQMPSAGSDVLSELYVFESTLSQNETKKPGLLSSSGGKIFQEFLSAIRLIQSPEYEIQGSRKYVDATTQRDGKIHHISLQEMVEVNLPSLIQSDKQWIEQMEKILKNIDDSDPIRKERIEKQNLEIFVDAFLRGWPAVFLPLEEQQDRYVVWQNKQREIIWRKIREILSHDALQMVPLQEDNVIFAVQSIVKRSLRITPYYLTTYNSFIALIDQKIGITYYINPWQHREEDIVLYKNKEQKRKVYFKAMQAANNELVSGNVLGATHSFQKAIRLYPIAAVEKILDSYWRGTMGYSSQRFKDFSQLATIMNDRTCHPKEYTKNLSHFIKLYPDFLADPYLYLGFSQYKETDLYFNAQKKLLEKQDAYNNMITLLAEESNMSGDLESGYRVLDIDRKLKFVLNSKREEIEQMQLSLQQDERLLWKQIEINPNEHIKRAMSIDNRYVFQVLNTGKLSFSESYSRYISPLYGVLRGQVFMELREDLLKIFYQGNKLNSLLSEWGISGKDKLVKQLNTLYLQTSADSLISPDDLEPLTKLIEFFEELNNVDSLMREQIAPQQIRALLSELLHRAFGTYTQAGNTVLGLAEIPRHLIDVYGLCINYLYAYSTILGVEKVTLINGYPNIQWQILNTDSMDISSLSFDEKSGQIVVSTRDQKKLPILKINGLSDKEKLPLKNEIQSSIFARKIRSSILRPAYAILYTPMLPPPLTTAWRDVLTALKPWLIYSFAHFSVLPMKDRDIESEEAFIHFDDYAVVKSIEVKPTVF